LYYFRVINECRRVKEHCDLEIYNRTRQLQWRVQDKTTEATKDGRLTVFRNVNKNTSRNEYQ